MRVAILCNGRTLAKWQRRAIALIGPKHEVFLLTAHEPPRRRRLLRHGLYYALNLTAIRNRETRPVPFPDSRVLVLGSHHFVPIMERSWAALPDETLRWLEEQRIEAIVKFSLGLLKLPDGFRVPVLSYHHGDPRHYRGRPAGFYELLNGERHVGQIVQLLSNRIDAGEVLAFSQTQAVLHNYRQTLVHAYALSPQLLPRALDALEAGKREAIEPTGRVYSLPSNLLVLRAIGKLWTRLLGHLAYGAFVEKRWRVSSLDCDRSAGPIGVIKECLARSSEWNTPRIAPPYTFYADPFLLHNSMVVEAMNGKTGKGELVLVDGSRAEPLTNLSGHTSYPAPVEENGSWYVIPEVAEWRRPAIFIVQGKTLRHAADLNIEEDAIVDPTPFQHGGQCYLFGNRLTECPSVLRLWMAPNLFGRFEQHPASPIRVSVRGSRMAGLISAWPQGLIRFGQDVRGGYGNGVLAFRIEELSPGCYREHEIGSVAFETVRGPHTVNLAGSRLVFDWYLERFSLFAGVRRVANRLSRKR